MTRRRKSSTPSTPKPSPEIRPETLARLETLTSVGDRAGERLTRIQPAHRRLRDRGAISPEAESAVQAICDEILRAWTGYRDPGDGSGEGCIVTAQMLAADSVRAFERRFGRGAVLLIAYACVECQRAAWVAHRILRFRAPRNPAFPTESWFDEGRKALDKVLIPLFQEMGKECPDARG